MKQSNPTGFSLVELLVAVALSLVLVAGVATVYMGSKQTYNARDELSVMQENARTALGILTRHLEHAGYVTPARLHLDKAFYTAADPTPVAMTCEDGSSNLADPAALRQTLDDDGNTGAGDTIGITFFADSRLFADCTSTAVPAACRIGAAPSPTHAQVYNSFYVALPGGEAVPNLYCAGSGAVQPVVEGVENIQFAYGLDTDQDGMVDSYLNAAGVDAAAGWAKVLAIKVALLMRSRAPVFSNAEARTYNLLGVDFTRSDRYQRTVHTAVVYLRNLAIANGG